MEPNLLGAEHPFSDPLNVVFENLKREKNISSTKNFEYFYLSALYSIEQWQNKKTNSNMNF